MRKLNTNDFIKCASLLGKIGKELEIDEGMSNAQVGVSIFATCMKHAETDFKIILADIAEMTVEEFEQQDFDFPIVLIEQISEQQNLQSFFIRVKGLANKITRK